MTTISIPISNATWQRLQTLAAKSGVSTEEFARASLEEHLRSREEFLEIAERVVTKNAELYQRLAK